MVKDRSRRGGVYESEPEMPKMGGSGNPAGYGSATLLMILRSIFTSEALHQKGPRHCVP